MELVARKIHFSPRSAVLENSSRTEVDKTMKLGRGGGILGQVPGAGKDARCVED